MKVHLVKSITLNPPLDDDTVIPELLGRCLSDTTDIHQSFVNPPNLAGADIGEIVRVVSAQPQAMENLADGRVPGTVKCRITRQISNYQKVFDEIWQNQKHDLIDLLDFEGGIYMIVTVKSEVDLQLPLNHMVGAVQFNGIQIHPPLVPPPPIPPPVPIQWSDTDPAKIEVVHEWFRTRIAHGEKVYGLEVCKIADESFIGYLKFCLVKFTRSCKFLRPRLS